MKGLFRVEESQDGKYIIGFNEVLYNEVLKLVPYEKRGSYNVLYARIMGLTYAEYLRYARDIYGATIQGKGHKFPIPVWDDSKECNRLCKELSTRWNKI